MLTKIVCACALAATLLSGCVETETYDSLRSFARTGSPDEARAELARILPKASDQTGGVVRVLAIGEDAFKVAIGEAWRELRYADLAPQAIVFRGLAPAAVRDRVWVRFTPGELDGWVILTLERNDVLCLHDDDADVVTLLDALDVLKADALARRARLAPTPVTPTPITAPTPTPAPAPAPVPEPAPDLPIVSEAS